MRKPGSEPDNPVAGTAGRKLSRIAIPIMLGMAVLFSCKKNDIEVIRNLTEISKLPQQMARNIETVYTDSARLQVRIKTPFLERFSEVENPYYEFPDGIYVEFYGKDEQVDSRLTARYAIYHEAEELWEARDSVVAVNLDGEVLNTDLLFWDEQKKLIYTDQFVRITTRDELIYGEGFEANQDFTDWKIRKVTGTIYVEQ